MALIRVRNEARAIQEILKYFLFFCYGAFRETY